MIDSKELSTVSRVALRKESVDRNKIVWSRLYFTSVALRKESVDRNVQAGLYLLSVMVALRKESVDRNPLVLSLASSLLCRSPQGERG